MLYSDETYGGATLMEMLTYLPPNASAGVPGPAFLNALTALITSRPAFTAAVPAGGGKVFVPAGRYRVEAVGGTLNTLAVEKPAAASRNSGTWSVRAAAPGWRIVRPSGGAVTLRWTRVGA
jgi:hypothetical protein